MINGVPPHFRKPPFGALPIVQPPVLASSWFPGLLRQGASFLQMPTLELEEVVETHLKPEDRRTLGGPVWPLWVIDPANLSQVCNPPQTETNYIQRIFFFQQNPPLVALVPSPSPQAPWFWPSRGGFVSCRTRGHKKSWVFWRVPARVLLWRVWFWGPSSHCFWACWRALGEMEPEKMGKDSGFLWRKSRFLLMRFGDPVQRCRLANQQPFGSCC